MKNETKEFIKRNERKIKIAFNIGVGIAFLSALLIEICNLKNENHDLKNKIKEQEKIIEKLGNTISKLKELCERKDAAHSRTIAIAMKEGSREAAREMAYKKHYLQQLKQVA